MMKKLKKRWKKVYLNYFDTIDEVAIDSIEQEEDDVGVAIEGVMDVRVSLNGFAYWGGSIITLRIVNIY